MSAPAPTPAAVTVDAATAGVASLSVASPASPTTVVADYGPTDPKATAAAASSSSSSTASASPSASPDADPVHHFLYFAYGSNMLPSMLKLKQVHVHSQRKGILRDVLMLFDLAYSSLVEPSYANLKRVPGASTHGILYELEARDMEAMDRMEGNGRSYVREEFEVELYDDAADAQSAQQQQQPPKTKLMAWAYICHPNNLSKVELKETPPSKRYLDVLIRGARHHELDPEYVQWLEGQASTPLPVLRFTPEQLQAIESRKITQAELEAHAWKDYMDDTPVAEWKDPLFMCLKGVVFDIRTSKYSNAWKKFNAGKCLTMFTAGRVAVDSTSIPTHVDHFQPEHEAYVNATCMDFATTYPIVGHMEDRDKYKF